MTTPQPAPDDARRLKSRPGPGRLLNALRWSWAGLAAAWRREAAFRQEVICCLPLALLALLLPLPPWLRLSCLGALVLVLVVELLNSAVEAAIDRVGPELHPLSKYAKDYGSAAVFLSLCWAGAIWAWALVSVLTD